MPTYDYRCDACAHAFEEFQSFSDPKLTKCPACGEERLRRLIGGGAAILFKGSGFYETDYRSESYKSAAKAEEGASKPADSAKTDASGGSGKSESNGSAGGSAKPASSAGG